MQLRIKLPQRCINNNKVNFPPLQSISTQKHCTCSATCTTKAFLWSYSAAERPLCTAKDIILITQWSTVPPLHFVILINTLGYCHIV